MANIIDFNKDKVNIEPTEQELDAAARGLVTALTGETEFDGIDHTFTQKTDAEAFERQQERSRKAREYREKYGTDVF